MTLKVEFSKSRLNFKSKSNPKHLQLAVADVMSSASGFSFLV